MPDDGPEQKGLTYRDAGVDIDAQDRLLARVKDLVRGTRTPGVLSDLGSFGGLFELALGRYRNPVLVSSCDGVGTKLRVAFETGIHDTVGRDLVNHCVNDILVQGAVPLFFMDYLAAGRLGPEMMAAVVEGVARGCLEAGCALLGGETAEMPDFYRDGEYDVVGFVVGIVDKQRIIDGSAVRPGNLLVALPSAGLHTNGYSLARKIFFEVAGLGVNDRVDGLSGSVGQELLAQHLCYLNPLSHPIEEGWINGLAHITGGGLVDNVPRMLPRGLAARIRRGSWPVLPVFDWLQKRGKVADAEMYRTFNMGVGIVAAVDPDESVLLESHFDRLGQGYHVIGDVVEGEAGVSFV